MGKCLIIHSAFHSPQFNIQIMFRKNRGIGIKLYAVFYVYR